MRLSRAEVQSPRSEMGEGHGENLKLGKRRWDHGTTDYGTKGDKGKAKV